MTQDLGQATEAPENNQEVETQEQPTQESKVWYEGMPDEMVGYIQNKGWEDPQKAIQSYQNLEKFQGADKNDIIKLPKGEDGEHDFSEVYAKLGRPDSPDGYTFEISQDIQIDEQRINLFKEVAHKTGVSQNQAKAILEANVQYEQKAMEEYNKSLQLKQESEMAEIKGKWGTKYDERLELSRRFIKDNLPQGVEQSDILTKIEDAIGTKNMLELFGNAGYKMNTSSGAETSTSSTGFGMTREQATFEKQRLMQEIGADRQRLMDYNSGKMTPDRQKIERYNKIVFS